MLVCAVLVVLGSVGPARAYKCPQSPSPPRTETYQNFLGRVYELDGQELPYRLFVPENYDPGTAYPLVLYLHHAGLAGSDQNNESGWDNCVQLTSEIGSGNDYGGVFIHRAVDEDGQRFDTQERYPHFLLAPHANSSASGFGGGAAGSASGREHPTRPLLWGILEQVQAEFNIDPGRLYVTGISMGCYGTWDIIMRSPGVFAAASPQSCRGDPDTSLLAALKDVPIWSMCGTDDSYFDGAQAMADGMEEIGATAFTFTAMQGVGHSINDRGYDYPGFIDWMFAQRLPGVPISDGMGGANGGGAGAMSGGGASVGGAVASMGGAIDMGGAGGTVSATGGFGVVESRGGTGGAAMSSGGLPGQGGAPGSGGAVLRDGAMGATMTVTTVDQGQDSNADQPVTQIGGAGPVTTAGDVTTTSTPDQTTAVTSTPQTGGGGSASSCSLASSGSGRTWSLFAGWAALMIFGMRRRFGVVQCSTVPKPAPQS